MDRETLTVILAQVLTTNQKWQDEVERNVLLQNTIEDLFNDEVFHVLLELGVFPKYRKTNFPHYRAVELICACRELARQVYEGSAGKSECDRELEEVTFKITGKWGTGSELEASQPLSEAISEAERMAELYKNDRQFAARLDRFRVLVLPLSITVDNNKSCQILILENIRPPRSVWTRRRR